mgnify:CR=1 FL=1|tara:strand:+ start:677 stop:2875 length:2199 start_codon:yes stop_codon:yes gene_type:complete
MIKRIIKILLIIILFLTLLVFYLSIFGIKTEKFNNQISKNILKINKKINLKLDEVNYFLNPYNFSVKIQTKNPQILLEGNKLRIKSIKSSISLKALINDQFLINDLQITTEKIKLYDVVTLIRSFQNSPQLFILNAVTKDGFMTANIDLNFNKKGKIKEDYKIIGSIKKGKFNFLNQFRLQNLNFDFVISKSNYSLKQVDAELNNIKLTSPLINIEKKERLFFVNGKILSDNKIFDIDEIKKIFVNLLDNENIKEIELSSINDFSFNVNKNLKFSGLKIETIINLNKLIFKGNHPKLKSYLPSFIQEIKFENHKISINYAKNKIKIKGKGNILIEDKIDSLSYQVTKNNDLISFDSKIKLKNNSLLIDLLDYEKKEGFSSLISLKGNLKRNNTIEFNLISLREKNNQILIKGLDLNKNFKIIDIEEFNISYKNNKNILNKLSIKNDHSNFTIEGESFDASQLINKIMDNNDDNSTIFFNFNSKINIEIKKTYIDKVNYINNLSGNLKFKNNEINNLELKSTFPNSKNINLSIKKNKNLETITKLFSSYPKPLIKRYDFIKGFEGGNLDFYSIKKNNISNSVIVIDNFKVKEVPIFAKLLGLASLQGAADLLTGEGIRFTDFEMNFSKQNGLIKIEEMYAIGPAVSILMKGYIESEKLVSLRGTLVPATTINRTIASIPFLGKILIGDKAGEGVFGVSFKIKGPPKNLKTTVNPIKTLTPRFITRTLEKIKKN